MQISVEATEYFGIDVQGSELDGSLIDPRASLPYFAFLSVGQKPTGTETWTLGIWNNASTLRFSAGILVGPLGAVQLPVGDYGAWFKASINPVIPVISAGLLSVF